MWQIRVVASPTLTDLFVFVFGLIIGSFLNVCIIRIPSHQSIVTPPSACPKCGARIRPYDNIPTVSYLLLGGKCRACKSGISPMYPLVELLTGLTFLACYRTFGLSVETGKWIVFSALMIVLVFTDLRERTLPDAVTYTGFAAGMAFSPFTKTADGTARLLTSITFRSPLPAPVLSFTDAILGAAVGSGVLWLIAEAYFRLMGREGMGQGDVKMMLMAGAFLGVERTLLMLFVGSLIGSVIGICVIGFLYIVGWKKTVAMRAHRMGLGTVGTLRWVLVRRHQLPFGTYLGIAGVVVCLFGTPILNWYQSVLMAG